MYSNLSPKKDAELPEFYSQLSVGNDSSQRPLILEFTATFVIFMVGLTLVFSAENDTSSIIFAMTFLLVGVLFVFVCGGNKYEYRAFLLSYSICVLVLGLSFTYSLSYFNKLMSTIDANTFMMAINSNLSSVEELHRIVDSVLPVLIWKQLSVLRESLNIGGNGPGIYILFNAMLVGITGVLVTKIANELFLEDYTRIKFAGTLFALCGMGWLFGSILIRDSYALLLNTISVWAIVKLLVTPGIKNLLLAVILTTISAGLMWYVREKASYLFVMYALLGYVVWLLKSNVSLSKVFIIVFIATIVMIAFDQISSQTLLATTATTYESDKYTIGSGAMAKSGSLGMALVVNQPLPIRVFVGSAYVLIFPIPLWGYFQLGLPEYFLIKGWHGIFMLLIMPLVLYSSLNIFKNANRKNPQANGTMFLVLYSIITVILVGVTTLETRHHGQFLAALIVLAASPKINTIYEKSTLTKIRLIWFGMIVGGHVLWSLISK